MDPVILPLSLADLIEKQLSVHQVGPRPNRDPYLFPGRVPGRPLRAEPVNVRLLAYHLGTPAAPDTALAILVTDVPIVVGDMIGIGVRTANQWLGYARTSWDDYLSARMDTPRPTVRT